MTGNRYHFSTVTNRPEKCEARKKPCKYSTHGDSPEAAIILNEKLLEEQVGGSTFSLKKPKSPSIIVPEKPEINELTLDEVKEGLSRVDKKIARQEVVSYGLLGSGLYGLQSPDSDRDIIVVVEGKNEHNDYHNVFDDGMDIRITTIGKFSDKVKEGIPNEIDLLRSGKMNIRGKYESYMKSLRFNPYHYYIKHHGHISKTQIKDQTPLEGSSERKREDKSIKTSLRGAWMMRRIREEGQFFRTEFTNEEREQYYHDYEALKRFRDNPDNTKQDIIDEILKYSNNEHRI